MELREDGNVLKMKISRPNRQGRFPHSHLQTDRNEL